MKRCLPLALSLFLCHCGTEVGNGVTSDNDTNTPKADSTTSESGQPQDASAPQISRMLSNYFLVACASPFADTISGTFTSAGFNPLSIGSTSGNQKTVTQNGGLLYTITPAPGQSPYAIEALSVSPGVTCGSINTETLSDSSMQRSTTLSDGVKVSWILKAGTVSSMKVVYSDLSEETWSKSD